MREHDYRSKDGLAGLKKSATLVVRKNEKYGAAVPGDLVKVDEDEVPNALRACETLEERDARETLAAAQAALPPKSSQITAMVEERFAALENAARDKALQKKMAAGNWGAEPSQE